MPDPLERLRSAFADRYAIHHELGRGGMAAVYLATDLRNRRRVALKVLADEVTSAISVARFLREIEIAGGLDHPHILPLLDSGSADGLAYFTMPFVDGESLRDRLRREKQLPIDDALRITTEVADALAYAHSRGIIHRDIKPDNILLADGHARVADFGIARAVTGGADGADITATGLAIGTPPYMSPEQLTGSRDLDGRSDVYSLGCVLYEMLAGEAPYTGPNAQAILAKRLREPLPKVSVVRETVPPHIERAIERALARAPADRFGNAGAFAEALASESTIASPLLARWGRRAAAMRAGAVVVLLAAAVFLWRIFSDRGLPDGDSGVIAVFPFRVHAEDASALYLREGILDYLSAQLTGDGVPRAVDSRTMLYAWRRATEDGKNDLTSEQALQVARRFGAGRVLLGEIVATKSATRLSGRILDSRGVVLAERTESGSDDPLLLIDRLTGRLLARSAGETEWRLPGLSDSLEAVKEYLAGVQAHRGSEYERSRSHLDRALAIDSTFALAALRMIRGGASRENMLRGTAAAWRLRERLSARDRAVVDAHFGVGPNYPRLSTTTERLRAHEHAATLNPDAADVMERFGTDLFTYGPQVGMLDAPIRAGTLIDSALALDPSYGPAAHWRLPVSLALRDTHVISRFSRLDESLNPATSALGFRLSAFVAMGDTAGMTRMFAKPEASLRGEMWIVVAASAAHYGLPSDYVERHLRQFWNEGRGTAAARRGYLRALFHMAAVQGRVRDAVALADSAANRELVLAMSISEPGYDSAAALVVERLDSVADSVHDADAICYRELWRVRRGDTSATRRSIRRMRELVQDYPPAPVPRVGRFGVCAMLLEVMVAANDEAEQASALARLEKVLREGVGLETPGQLATLLVARARYERGDYAIGYDIVRRRPFIHNVFFTIVLPAHLREEGRLAAALGDTAEAIRAYRHYLALRMWPDPGPATEEVRQVRDHLRALQPSSGRQDGIR